MSTRQLNKTSLRFQTGAATLLIAVVLLISVTLIVLLTAQTVITEQRIAANQERAKQAYEAGAAGLSYVLGQAQDSGPAASSGAVATPTGAPNFTASTVWSDGILSITSVGTSDDGSATRTLYQSITGTPALANAPENPLTSKGTIDIKGSGTIWNLESTTTIWSGSSTVVTGMSPKTIIKHDEAADGYIESTNASNKGLDVIDNDPNLGTLTDDQYFQNFFGVTPSVYESSIARDILDPDTTSVTTLDGTNGTIIWVDGDARFTSNIQIGTEDEPVVVVVDGLMWGAGNVTVYGFLYVVGDWDAQGNLTVNGAVVVRGDVDGTGSLDVFFDSSVLNNLATAGKTAGIPGTWRDWNP